MLGFIRYLNCGCPILQGADSIFVKTQQTRNRIYENGNKTENYINKLLQRRRLLSAL